MEIVLNEKRMKKVRLDNFTLSDLRDWTDAETYVLAEGLVLQSCVHSQMASVAELQTNVHDADEYVVAIENDIYNTAFCDCGAEEYPCKHIIASLIAFHEVRELERGDLDSSLTGDVDTTEDGVKSPAAKLSKRATKKAHPLEKLSRDLEVGAKQHKEKLHPVEKVIQGTTWRDLADYLIMHYAKDKSIVKDLQLHFENDPEKLQKILMERLSKLTQLSASKVKPGQLLAELQQIAHRADQLDPSARCEVNEPLLLCAISYLHIQKIEEELLSLALSLLPTVADFYRAHNGPEQRLKFSHKLCSALVDLQCEGVSELISTIPSFLHSDEEKVKITTQLQSVYASRVMSKPGLTLIIEALRESLDDMSAAYALFAKYASTFHDYELLLEQYIQEKMMSQAEQLVFQAMEQQSIHPFERVALGFKLVPWFMEQRNAAVLLQLFLKQVSVLPNLLGSSVYSRHYFGDIVLPHVYQWPSYTALVSLYPEFLAEQDLDIVLEAVCSRHDEVGLSFYHEAQSLAPDLRERVQKRIESALLSYWNEHSRSYRDKQDLARDQRANELVRLYTETNNIHQIFELLHTHPLVLLGFIDMLRQDYYPELVNACKELLERSIIDPGEYTDRETRDVVVKLKKLLFYNDSSGDEWRTFVEQSMHKHPRAYRFQSVLLSVK